MHAKKSLRSQEYIWRNVAIGGCGFVTGIVTHPRKKGLMYARTDVGGAYRTDDSGQSWIPVTDWIGIVDVNLTGIESIALDPDDPKRVYLAAGTYCKAGNGAILRSNDMCRTFERIDMPFQMGGNEMGRGNGERLSVDPNCGRVLFFGSRNAGLWKSNDYGKTWNKVENFPEARDLVDRDASRSNEQADYDIGIVCVRFDAATGSHGSPTPAIYAAVSVNGTSVFRSLDFGETWHAVPGQPLGLRPNHIVPSMDNMMYISYGKEPGPNTMTDGAVWRFAPATGEWTDITPEKPGGENLFGYGSVSVDSSNPDIIVASSFCRYKRRDEIFRSTDRGTTWRPMLAEAVFDFGNAPWTRGTFVHWMADVEIDPFDSDHIMFTTGYGIWGSVNATEADRGRSTTWEFQVKGLEESVPLGLVSPSDGPHLLSAIGDYDGFVHDDVDDSPSTGQYKMPPRFTNSESISIASRKSNVVARSGINRLDGAMLGACSLDTGATWNVFRTMPENTTGFGPVAVSADGGRIVWSLRQGGSYVTSDYGDTWHACNGLAGRMRIVADCVNPQVFYALDSASGTLYVSRNGALDFIACTIKIPAAPDYGGGFGGEGGPGAALFASPSCEADLWIAVRKGGVYRTTDAFRSLGKIEGVLEAYSIGFGKTAPGITYPAIFLAGMIDNLVGVFRSDDEGKTWIRINDERHQFGWINHVTGDPRIFGRVYFGTAGRGIIYGDIASQPF